MDQLVINWLLGLFGALIGACLAVVWQSVRDLQKSDKDIIKKISEIEVLVAGDYIRKDAFDKLSHDIFALLHRIEDKLDKKVDR